MGKVAEIKTKENNQNVTDFIESLEQKQKREDSYTLVDLMERASGAPPKMWGSKIIGFGNKRYKSPNTSREVDWFKIGFSPRKADFSLHLVLNLQPHEDTLKKLGKYKSGVGCLYISKLENIDLIILKDLIISALKEK